ncbi:hypothetical protein J2T10_004171 [Paenarthrobacter nicotinovorans]|uniref:Uncharacterized protein n=1 Tax=Paenarthrobacter nicotinovorans TaxID=29320 RepID=A0ABT9TS41_PAENI|nr:hypothetical protein [Paenarthrobacter nicotinovorans]
MNGSLPTNRGATLSVVETDFGEAGTAFEMLGDELTAQDGAFIHIVITWAPRRVRY